MFTLVTSPINRAELISKLTSDQAGALVIFEGHVRDHNQGKKVSSLEYQVYESLAIKEGNKILLEAVHRFNLHHILCHHRYGHLNIGDSAVWIGASATHRDDAFKATRYVIDEIKHRLPIWKKEHYLNEMPSWVFCKDHHTHVHFKEEDYYKKQSSLINQGILKKSKVLVVGAGGLGCPVLISLVSAGVGHIDIVDFDKVSISNIHRQHLFTPEVVGEKKVFVAQNKLTALNPFIHVSGIDARIDSSNVEQYLRGQDLIIDCSDNLDTKFLLHDACFKLNVPLISASLFKFEGQIRTFIPGESSCLRCLWDNAPDDTKIGNCNDFGVLSSVASVIGSTMANEALLYLTDKKNNTTLETFYLNLKTLSQMKIKNIKKNLCLCCSGEVNLSENHFEVSPKDAEQLKGTLVDLRDKDDSVITEYLNSVNPIILYCHRGIRSKNLTIKLRSQGHNQFYSLKGGACSL